MAIRAKSKFQSLGLKLRIAQDILHLMAGTTILALGLGIGIQSGLLNQVSNFFENISFAIFGFFVVILSHRRLSVYVENIHRMG